MFRKSENKKLCETVLNEVAERHGIKIAELSVMPEHVHMVGDIPPVMSVSRAFNVLKGAALAHNSPLATSNRTSL